MTIGDDLFEPCNPGHGPDDQQHLIELVETAVANESDEEDVKAQIYTPLPLDISNDDEDDAQSNEEEVFLGPPPPQEPPAGFKYVKGPPREVSDAEQLPLVQCYILHTPRARQQRLQRMG